MSENTAAKDQLDAFREEMTKIKFDSELDETYGTMLQELDTLVKETDRFYTETNGKYPKMDEDSFDHFTHLYQNTFDSMKECREAISSQAEESENKGWAVELIGSVQQLLGKDLVMLSSAKEKGLSTLPKIVEQARAQIIDVTGQEISSVGANMSNRRKITVPGKNGGDSVSGFFTESVSSDEKTEMKALYERTVQKNPNMKKLIDIIDRFDKEGEEQGENVWRVLEKRNCDTFIKMVNQGGVDPTGQYCSPEHMFDMDLSDYFTDKELNTFFEKDNLAYPFVDYLNERNKIGNKYRVFEMSGIEKNNDLDERNSAMSFMADLLGMDGLIARAEPMILQDGEKKISGTFMHYANGVDIGESKIGDPLLRPGAEIDCNSDDLKKQVADLQVLDYICGNTDRHGANMFYQIDDSNQKHPRITGIQGIDNDNSFGTITEGIQQLPALRHMGVIREDTAKVVTALNEDMLKTTLRNFKLSDEEIQAAWDRTKQLQDAIKDGMEFYKDQAPDAIDEKHLRIVKDQEWSKFEMSRLAEKSTSYFAKVSLVQDNAITMYFEKESAKADKEYRESSVQVNHQKAGISDMSQTLKTASKGVWGGSRQYDRVMDAVNHLQGLHGRIYQKDFKAGAQELKEAYRQTIEVAKEYLKHKQDELDEKVGKKKSESEKQKVTEKFMDPEGKNYKRIVAVSTIVSQLEKYEAQLNQMETSKAKSDDLTKMKKLSPDDMMKEIGKLMPKQKGERVLMTREELFERPRSRSMVVKKAPEEAKNLERRSMNPRSLG